MKTLIKKLLREMTDDVLTKKQYIGQCDLLRRKCEENEAYWHDMMKNRKKIPFNTFIKNVDMSPMIEDDETPKIWIKEALMSDSETASYVSNWGGKECMFIQTAGFEFIFV